MPRYGPAKNAGILENTDVLVKDGKIAKIGKDLKGGNAKVVDATGKHLTAGVIDEHTHIAGLGHQRSGTKLFGRSKNGRCGR